MVSCVRLVFIITIVFGLNVWQAIHDFDALDVPLQTLFWLAVLLIKVTPLVEALCGKDFL